MIPQASHARGDKTVISAFWRTILRVMTLETFIASVTRDSPPLGVSAPLVALWYDARDEWDKAHQVAQDDHSREAAWVHAYLHRKEGDLENAAYWYRRAGQAVATDTLAAEWTRLVESLLTTTST